MHTIRRREEGHRTPNTEGRLAAGEDEEKNVVAVFLSV